MLMWIRSAKVAKVAGWVVFGVGVLTTAYAETPVSGEMLAQMRKAVNDAQPKVHVKLGNLEVWQKKIYDDEVLVAANRFVKDYRMNETAKGRRLSIEVDLDGIASYVKFYAPKALLTSADGKTRQRWPISVVMLGGPACPACQDALPSLTRIMKLRLENRGFTPVFVKRSELPPQFASLREIEESVTQSAYEKGYVGAYFMELANVPAEEIDAAHADEVHLRLQSVLRLAPTERLAAQVEVDNKGDKDAFDRGAGRLWVNLMMDAGPKFEALARKNELDAIRASGKAETEIEVSGFRDFLEYMRVKSSLQNKFGDQAQLEDRKISRGRATFAVLSPLTAEALSVPLKQVRLDPGVLVLKSMDGSVLKMEVRP